MKRNLLPSLVLLVVSTLFVLSCSSSDDTPADNENTTPTEPTEPDAGVLDSFWFGFYQEDATTNPEDPLPGFIYVNIPDTGSGTFEGELFFSYSGCAGGLDLGRATGTAVNGSLQGTWQGTVDGVAVGGEYSGQLNSDENIDGAYTNEAGKVEIECDPDFSYFVAPRGSLFLQNTNSNSALNIRVEPESSPLSLIWNGVSGAGVVYNVVFIDAECLDQEIAIRDCLMWIGQSTADSIVYGEGITDDVPVEPLVSGKTYLVSVTAVTSSGEAVASSNITFVYP